MTAPTEHDYAEDDYGYDDAPACSWCGGQPWMQECGDPIQCCKLSCDGEFHGCDACGDTGLAKHQVMW